MYAFVVQIACAVVVFGYVAGVDGEINFTWLGVIFGACSSVGVSLYSIFSKKYMTVLNGDQWLLLYYNNVNSMILMPFISLAFGEHGTHQKGGGDEWFQIHLKVCCVCVCVSE